MNSKALFFAVALLAAGVFGCTPTMEITYDTSEISPADSSSKSLTLTRATSLDIEPFEDIRSTQPENGLLFVRGRETKLDDKRYCINAEKHYRKDSVAAQVAGMIGAHFAKRGSFKAVVTNAPNAAEYRLTGKLKRLYGEQEVSTSAQVGAMFGLIGALATMGATTDGKISIEFTDLTLHRQRDGAEKKIGDCVESFTGELGADAECWCIYENVNSHLKNAVDKLALAVENAIADLEGPKP